MLSRLSVVLLVISATLVAQDAPATQAAARPEPQAATKGTVRTTLERKGTLVPFDGSEVSLWLEAYGSELMVMEAARHGSPVNEGDVIVRLDLRKIDEQVRQGEFDLAQAEQKLRAAEELQRIQEETAQSELARTEKDNAWTQRRLRGFFEREKDHKKESERLSEQSQTAYLEDQRDELAQLEKMYKEDELVDATEEIVLKRSRRSLAHLLASVELERRVRAYTKELNDTIQQESLEFEAAQKTAGLDRQRRAIELGRAARGQDMARSRLDFEKQKTALDRLRRDRDLMTIRAPRKGIVLHGAPNAAPGSVKLDRGSMIEARKVFMTIAEPGRLQVVTDIPEAEYLRAKTGTAAEVAPAGVPDLEITSTIRVAALPTARDGDNNLYETTLPIERNDLRLRPGMRCTVTVVVDEARDAVLIPNNAVDKRADGTYVKVGKTKAGPFEERKVVLGAADARNVAVKDGVLVGEFVLAVGGAAK